MEENTEKQKVMGTGLKPYEIKIWQEINDLLQSDALSFDIISLEAVNDIQKKKIAFADELRIKGINPEKYLLWHKLATSTVFENLPLDTDKHDIANFVIDLYKEYNNK